MNEFYTPKLQAAYEKKAKRSLCACLFLFIAVFVFSVAACCLVTTRNASRLLTLVLCVFTAGGWAAILVLQLAYFPARAQARHMASCLSGEKTVFCGRAVLSERAFQIPKSICIHTVTLSSADETVALSLNALFARVFPASQQEVRVTCANNYIISVEVLQ